MSLLTHSSCKGGSSTHPCSNPLLESPAIRQAVPPLQKGLAEQLPQPRQGLYQGLKIKLYLSLNTPLLVLAAPFQVSPASPGKHVPILGATGLLHSSEGCIRLPGFCAPTAFTSAASSQGGRAPALMWLQQGCCREQRKELEADSWSGCCLVLLETGVENWHQHPSTPTNIAFICRATEQMICQLFIWRTGFTSLD